MKAHGNFHCEIEKQLLICTLTGSWNAEEARDFCQSVLKSIEQISSKPWDYIVNALDFDGGTPEAYQINNDMLETLKTANLSRRAIISKGTVYISISKQFQPAFEHFETRYFDNIDNARIWLKLKKPR